MCLHSSLFYFLYLPSYSGSWYLLQVLLCITTPMKTFSWLSNIINPVDTLSFKSESIITAAMRAFSYLCPVWHTHSQNLLIPLITKAFTSLPQGGQSLVECPASPSFYGPQAPPILANIPVFCSALKSNTFLWCPDNRAELCQRVSSRVISRDLGTISERALPHGVPCLPRWPSRNHLHLVGQQMLPSQSSTMARLGPQMHPGFICTPPGDHSHI